MDQLEKNIASVRRRIAAAAQRSGRDAGEITLVAVSKFVDIELVRRAMELGLTTLAENRVQELARKAPLLPDARWHVIGHLQTNKVGRAVELAELIHSVDSLRLLEAIDKKAKELNKIQDILLEVNISSEESKYGLTTEEFHYIINKLRDYPSVRLRGLMAMAPNFENKELCRPVFRDAARLFGEIKGGGVNILSMGMSGDFEIAVEEGATHVRVGSAIFKEGFAR